MKIKPEHYVTLKSGIEAFVNTRSRRLIEEYKEGLLRDSRVKDLNKRFRWDLLYASRQNELISGTLYQYLNDDHIDTALRSIVSELSL